MDDIDGLKALAQELFGTSNNIPPAYMRELKRYVDTATAKLGLAIDSYERAAYWIDGRSLGVLGSTGIDDKDLANISGIIRQLDHVTAVNLTVGVHRDSGSNRAYTGRRLTIGDPDNPDVVLDASPGRFLPEKRVQIEHFIDQLLATLAGRASP